MKQLATARAWFTYFTGISPNIWQLPNPLKTIEFEELTRGVDLRTGQRILDLGCGRGIQAQLLAKRGPAVVGVDPGEKYIRNARRELRWSRMRSRVEFHCGVLEELNFFPEMFDKVYSFCVLEHIPNLSEVLRALHRILAPEGEIHATVDALANVSDRSVVETHRKMYKVERYFRPDIVESTFGAEGFKVIEQRYILRGSVAINELKRQIEFGDGQWPCSKRRRGADELRQDESRFKATDPGIMILCRLKKV